MPKAEVIVWKSEHTPSCPWRFAVVFNGQRQEFGGVPNQYHTRRQAAIRGVVAEEVAGGRDVRSAVRLRRRDVGDMAERDEAMFGWPDEEPWLTEEQEAEERRHGAMKGRRDERRFKLTSTSVPELNGLEFTVASDATEEEIAQAAADLAIESISFGWDEVAATRKRAQKRKSTT